MAVSGVLLVSTLCFLGRFLAPPADASDTLAARHKLSRISHFQPAQQLTPILRIPT